MLSFSLCFFYFLHSLELRFIMVLYNWHIGGSHFAIKHLVGPILAHLVNFFPWYSSYLGLFSIF